MPKERKSLKDDPKYDFFDFGNPDLIGMKCETFVDVNGNIAQTITAISNKYFPYTSIYPECPNCGGDTEILESRPRGPIADIPYRGKPTFIMIDNRRFVCKKCGFKFKIEYSDVPGKGKMTASLKDYIRAESLELIPYSEIARRIGVTEKSIRETCDPYFKQLMAERTFELPPVIGMDEDHFKALYENSKDGEKTLNGDYVFVLTNPVTVSLLDILPTRKKEALISYFKDREDLGNVKIAVMDMWKPYFDVCKECFPDAVIIIDRFHVIKAINKCVDNARKKLKKDYQDKAADNQEQRKIAADFLAIRDLMAVSVESLSEEQITQLATYLQIYPELRPLYWHKEDFRSIYKECKNKKEARKAYDEWAGDVLCPPEGAEILHAFDSFVNKTFVNWGDEIVNYFDYADAPVTNGPTESINNVIKSVMRVGRGYSFPVLRAKAILGFEARKERKVRLAKRQYEKKQLAVQLAEEEQRVEDERLLQAIKDDNEDEDEDIEDVFV